MEREPRPSFADRWRVGMGRDPSRTASRGWCNRPRRWVGTPGPMSDALRRVLTQQRADSRIARAVDPILRILFRTRDSQAFLSFLSFLVFRLVSAHCSIK